MGTTQDDELKTIIIEADEGSLEGRLERLRFLLANLGEDYAPLPAIVLEFFEETKLCFYEGAFVSSILMASATFEELFRQIYRDANEMKKANTLGLANLVGYAVKDGLISSSEAKELTKLRKLRNKFTHIGIGFKGIDFEKKRTFLDLTLLWGDPRREPLPIEGLAKDAIKIFARLVSELCNRFWGTR